MTLNPNKEGENMKKCKSCKSEIDSKATKCPHCRTDQRIWFRRHPILTFLIVLFIAPFILAGMTGSSPPYSNGGSTTPVPTKQSTFNAGVNFTGTQFVISNLEKYACENARMKVNGDYSLDGYNLESALDSTVKTGTATVYKVGAGQFTKGDGTRFNPFATKPLNFSISCRGNNELSSAFGYWEFK